MAHDGESLHQADAWRVVDCVQCGYAHVDPLPSVEDVAAHYSADYWRNYPSYLGEIVEDRAWHQAVLDERLQRIEQAVVGRRLLDVGCGAGLFLERALAAGWQAFACEPDGDMAERAGACGAQVLVGGLENPALERLGRFDAIHLYEVLEHVPEPALFLQRCWDLLSPGGVLYVGVPNDFNAWQKALQAGGLRPWWVAVPHHLNYFGHASLRRLLERQGFVAEQAYTSFPMEFFALAGEVYIGDVGLGREVHRRRMQFEASLRQHAPESLADFYRALAEQGLGRTAEWLMRKPRAIPEGD